MPLHPWWGQFGETVPNISDLTVAAARALATTAASGDYPGLRFVEARRGRAQHCEAVLVDVDVERPQDLGADIRATEPIAFVYAERDMAPSVVALRDDFPDTMHQNWTPLGVPSSLCIDDRPWIEIKLTSTTADVIRRTQLWLAKAARGDLHDPAQPIDPLFYQSHLTLVIPGEAIGASAEPVELVGFVRDDNPNIIITAPSAGGVSARAGFIAVAFQASPQAMSRMRHAPTTLTELIATLEPLSIDLVHELKSRIHGWAGLQGDNLRRLTSRLAIIIAFPITEGDRSASDLRAFMTYDTAGEIGVALGVIEKNVSDVGSTQAYLPLIIPRAVSDDIILKIEPVQVHFQMERLLARTIAGHRLDDTRRAVLVGAGSLGSQLSLNLAREGLLSWSVVDGDFLLPHNLARHALFTNDVGAPKAAGLAHQLGNLLGETVLHFVQDIVSEDIPAELTTELQQADFILDASASVPVSRYLSDLKGVDARRVSIFFNPAGTAVVVLAEDADRSITLRDMEAQYHNLIISTPALAGHLTAHGPGLRFSGSCRALTNRIPASRASLLSAVAAEGVKTLLQNSSSTIRIWTISEKNEVTLKEKAAAPVTHLNIGDWTVVYDDGLITKLGQMREERLPDETGGVLLGIIDVSRRSIHVVEALPQPSDSVGSPSGFERGVIGLTDDVRRAAEATMHQIRYVGEWHSHPQGTSPIPSEIDRRLLAWLWEEMRGEGLPALMAIAADNGTYSFTLARETTIAVRTSSPTEASS